MMIDQHELIMNNFNENNSYYTARLMSKPKEKPLNIKVVFLKELPKHKQLYQSHEIHDDLCQRFTPDLYARQKNINKTSIAYLSSILQDENTLTENSTLIANRPDSYHTKRGSFCDSDQKVDYFRKSSSKSGNRYLSCLLKSQTKPRKHSHHSKTEGIDQLIAEKKIMPIDQLRHGLKNIEFSSKNKQDLNKDFNEFVEKKEEKSLEQHQGRTEKKTILIARRKQDSKRCSDVKGDEKRQKKMRMFSKYSQQLQQENLFLERSNKKIKPEEEDDKGFALRFKKMTNDLPIVRNFVWSKLNDNPYQLHSN